MSARRQVNWTRVGKNVSAGIVAGIAGYASYWHMASVALRAGERAELAHVMPLSVDGMLIVASIAMVDDRQQGLRPRPWAKAGFLIGITASIAANVTAAQPTWLGRVVAAWPALALLLVVEILSSRGHKSEAEEEESTVEAPMSAPAATVQSSPPKVKANGGKPRTRKDAEARAAEVERVRQAMPAATLGQVAGVVGISDRHARRVLNGANGNGKAQAQ